MFADYKGNIIPRTYDILGNIMYENDDDPLISFDGETYSRSILVAVNDEIKLQSYEGGYIEIQPDSWDGSPTHGDYVPTTDPTAWGFPSSLTDEAFNFIRDDILNGDGKGIMYVRFPLGFAYRGYRNIDAQSGLARNIGERWEGQNSRLREFMSKIADAGGGIAPEYWCPPPHWLTSGTYQGPHNHLTAGGTYDRSVNLEDIRTSDPTQYNAQINAFTDAIINDLEYLHTNVCPVRMFGLQNEPEDSTEPYGACYYDYIVYGNVLDALIPKIRASSILSVYDGRPNTVKIHMCSSYNASMSKGIAVTKTNELWGYSWHSMRESSGEDTKYNGADGWYKSDTFSSLVEGKENVFCNEYEYFGNTVSNRNFRFANNALRLINELVYSKAKVLHPIIHICKPTGQTLSSTNTEGYCLYAVNMAKRTYSFNAWAYNSWKMFNDNLPIGATLVGDYSVRVENGGFVTFENNGKLYVFVANCSDSGMKFTMNFQRTLKLKGKAYSLDICGDGIKSKTGSTFEIIVPKYSAQCWIES